MDQKKYSPTSFLRHGLLRNIFIVAVLISIGLVLYGALSVWPAFRHIFVKGVQDDSIQVARHLTSRFFPEGQPLSQNSITPHFTESLPGIMRDFSILKIKVFAPSGEIVFSTDPKETGTVNRKPYFHERVALGKTYAIVVRKETKSLEDQVMALDVVETYVPVMKGKAFLGAFEIYYDITERLQSLSAVVQRFSIVAVIVLFVLLTVLTAVLVKGGVSLERRRKAEQELIQEKKKVQNYLDIAGVALLVVGSDERVVVANREACKMVKRPEEDLIGKNWFDTCIPDVRRDEVRAIFAQLLSGHGEAAEYREDVVLTGDGEHRLVAWRNSVLRDDRGTIWGTLNSGEDITDRREAERRAEEEHQRFADLFESGPYGMIMIGREGRFLHANSKFKSLFGYGPDEVYDGRTWFRRAFPQEQYRKMVVSLWQKDVGTFVPGEKVPRLLTVTCRDGSEKIVNIITVQLGSGDYIVSFEDVTERVEASEALRRSEEKHRAVIESTSDAIVMLDLKRDIVSCNTAFLQLFGYEKNDIMGKSVRITHRSYESFEYLGERIYPDVKKKGTARIEWVFARKDGSLFPAETVISVVRLDDGTIGGYAAIMRDITDRKSLEEGLVTAKARAELIFQVVPSAIFTVDRSCRITGWNRKAEEITGYMASEAVGAECFLFAEYPCKDGCGLLNPDVPKPVVARECTIRRKDGSMRFISKNADYLRDSAGNIVGGIESFEDVTERRTMENVLRESEEKFKSLVEKSIAGVYIVEDGLFRYVNRRFADIHGYEPEEMVNKLGPKETAHPDDFPVNQEYIRKRLAGEIDSAHFVFRALRKDGTVVHVEVFGSQMTYQGNPAIIGTLIDVSDRVRAEETIKRMAFHDALTGLPNRRSLDEELRRAIALARRGTVSSLLYMDLDNFKSVNDTLGHDAGDGVLVNLTNILQEKLRREDIVFRLGGDEFAVLLRGIGGLGGKAAAERLRTAVGSHNFTIKGIRFDLSLSIGLVQIDGDKEAGVLLSEADALMYRAKEAGKNRIFLS